MFVFRSETKETEGFWAPTSVSLLGLHHEAPRRLVGMGWHSMGPESPWRVLKIFYAEGDSWKWWKVKELQKNQPLNHLSNSGFGSILGTSPKSRGYVQFLPMISQVKVGHASGQLISSNIPTTAEPPKASRLRVCESHPVLDALVPWDPKKMVVRFAGDFFFKHRLIGQIGDFFWSKKHYPPWN